MSKANLEQFMNKVADSVDLQAKIGEEIDADSLIALGAECGCEFTAEDLQESGELSDEELDGVAGGGREERKERRAIKRIGRKALREGGSVIKRNGEVIGVIVKSPTEEATTEYWDDGSGDPTKLN
jgi:predicted ribosomally synthesized peptide with nif11-like leader